MTKLNLIPDEQKNRMIREANRFKVDGGTHEEFLKVNLYLPKSADFLKIHELRNFYIKLRKIRIANISNEDREKLFSLTHSYNHFLIETMPKKQKEKIYLLFGKSLKMLQKFDEEETTQPLRSTRISNQREKRAHRDRQGLISLKERNGRY